ncbi:MAG TPA: bifunctional DNA-formamidopyrimidine glycosylase/DNA-(apurinic or apyrimidinic site) lyase [Candidatus Moranbacteria bacterium]|nr:bifunctional DNA-formamidopyrimidine glycosylase/DNA-(apurinic or apyrimidinic site) lyase [Candidatus Moranbacteria bacterium]
MPELPEVQTIVNDLNKKIKGDTITDFWSDWAKAIKGKSLEAFKKEIRGRKIVNARTIGKNIFIDLSGGKTLYIHLKMTGHLLIKFQKPNSKSQIKSKKQNSKSEKADYFEDKVNKYIHHIWYLRGNPPAGGKTLEFSDLRKFAKIVLDDTEKIQELPEIKALGIDAMSPELNFKKFQEILSKKSKVPIGLLLMDQTAVSGIGNIYRSEILFEAGVLPERKIADLSAEEIKLIFKNIKKVLQKAIKFRGTSDSDYRDTSGAPGSFQNVMKVYNKAGKKCPASRQTGPKCDTIIIRKKFGQRSVFICPDCQK